MYQPMISVQQVADRLGVSIYTVYRLKDKPDGIPAYKVAGCIRFHPDEVEAYVKTHAIKPVAAPKPAFKPRRFTYVPGMKVV